MTRTILVTGGAGYIGSHAVIELRAAGYDVVVYDNLCNSSPEVLNRLARITGRKVPFVQGDIRDAAALRAVLAGHRIDAVIHFAGLKAVGESVAQPLTYYDNNVIGTNILLGCLAAAGVRRFVFSSSATVYGDPERVPLDETARTGATNPYGRTKWIIELILQDLAISDPSWGLGLLRYFNPVGAHESGLIGEDPGGTPNNLMPFIAQVAVGRHPKLKVFGDDWPTRDGTGVRDFIHVVDLARGHVAALDRVFRETGAWTVNLGTGIGYTVLELARAFEKASSRAVPYEVVARRPGDIAECYADPSKANRELGWHAGRDLAAMCADTWRWQHANPNGYGRSAG